MAGRKIVVSQRGPSPLNATAKVAAYSIGLIRDLKFEDGASAKQVFILRQKYYDEYSRLYELYKSICEA